MGNLKTMERPRFYSPVAMQDVVKHNLNVLSGEPSEATYALVFESAIGAVVKDFAVEVDGKTFNAIDGRVTILVEGVEEFEALGAISYKASADGYLPVEGTVKPENVNKVVFLRWAAEPIEAPKCCCCK